MKEFKNLVQGADIGQIYEPAMKIAMEGDVETAKRYFHELVDLIDEDLERTKGSRNREEAVSIAHSNLGYYAGYHSRETRVAVKNVFGSSHPVFGDTFPTPKEAFEMGMKLGEKWKSEKG